MGATSHDLERVSSNLNMLSISAISPIGSPAGGGQLSGLSVPPLSLPVGSPPGATATLSLSAAGLGSPRLAAKKASPFVPGLGAANGGPTAG